MYISFNPFASRSILFDSYNQEFPSTVYFEYVIHIKFRSLFILHKYFSSKEHFTPVLMGGSVFWCVANTLFVFQFFLQIRANFFSSQLMEYHMEYTYSKLDNAYPALTTMLNLRDTSQFTCMVFNEMSS